MEEKILDQIAAEAWNEWRAAVVTYNASEERYKAITKSATEKYERLKYGWLDQSLTRAAQVSEEPLLDYSVPFRRGRPYRSNE